MVVGRGLELQRDKGLGRTGWKLHVPVGKPEEAFPALARYLMEQGVAGFKFARPKLWEVFLDPRHEQAGKFLVVYHSEKNLRGDPIDWKKIVADLDAIVKRHGGVPPPVGGNPVAPRHDKKLGSFDVYVYCRLDRDKNGRYVPAAEISGLVREGRFRRSQAYRLGRNDVPCPFEGIGEAPERGRAQGEISPAYGGLSPQLQEEIGRHNRRAGEVGAKLVEALATHKPRGGGGNREGSPER